MASKPVKSLSDGSSSHSSDKSEKKDSSEPFALPSWNPMQMDGVQLIGTVDVRSSLQIAKDRKGQLQLPREMSTASYILQNIEEEKWKWEIDPKKLLLKKFIAKGTYGTVHRGIYDGMDVAVKLLDWGEDEVEDRADLTEIRRAFVQEVTVWSTLNHKNVTQFVGALVGGNKGFHIPSHVTGTCNGRLLVDGHVSCVVLEYLPGGTLKQLLLANHAKKLPLKSVVRYATDIAEGLAYLHSKHIVHRDMKSENVLLDKQKVLKIADFGVSRVESESSKDLEQLAGTYGYMAPEVLMGVHYNHKVDVYSFGILLWEIYCCENPFPFSQFTPSDIKNLVIQGLRPDIPSCCPPDLARIMCICWDKNPERRPDMIEVVEMLKKVDVIHGRGMVPAMFEGNVPLHNGAVHKVVNHIKSKLNVK